MELRKNLNFKRGLFEVKILLSFITAVTVLNSPVIAQTPAENQLSLKDNQVQIEELKPIELDLNNTKLALEDEADLKGRATEEKVSPLRAWLDGDYATTDWRGLRSYLEEHGVAFDLIYTTDSFFKLRGGINKKHPIRYTGLVDTAINFDTEKMGLWSGGKVHVHAQNYHGRSLSERDLGDFQGISSIDAQKRLFQLSEYWYEQGILDGKLRVKLGKQEANDDFSALDSSFNFLHPSLSLIPTIPMTTYPDTGLGVVTFVEPTEWFSLKAGVFDGEANGGTSGFNTAFNNNGQLLTMAESSLSHSFRNQPGKLLMGFWHHTGDAAEITGSANARTFSTTHGIYTALEQMLYKENREAEDDQGLTAHAQYGWCPSDRSELARYYGLGAQYKGLIPGRQADIVGIGSAFGRFSGRLKNIDGRKGETALELFYLAQLTPWLALQPDFQYIYKPNGNAKSAVAFGIRSMITF